MTTPQVKTRITSVRRSANSVRRAAFTLVELMVVILIIGILAGIAAPVIFRALRVSKEFTITNEVQQMNAAVERFNTDHGFYPPTIGPGLEVASPADMTKYLNRIAPNNAEISSGGLAAWWTNVGMHLDQRSSLVFWLSGLCTSKQYPLSGNAALAAADTPPAPYNSNKLFDGNDFQAGVTIDRNEFFEFKSAQLEPISTIDEDTTVPAGIQAYLQPNGSQPKGTGQSLAYIYRDFKSYMSAGGNAYHNGDPTIPANYVNPTTFQIVGPGMDGQLFNPDVTANTNLVNPTDPFQDDNITNFSNGRLEKSFE